jgi:hypothetical protein
VDYLVRQMRSTNCRDMRVPWSLASAYLSLPLIKMLSEQTQSQGGLAVLPAGWILSLVPIHMDGGAGLQLTRPEACHVEGSQAATEADCGFLESGGRHVAVNGICSCCYFCRSISFVNC